MSRLQAEAQDLVAAFAEEGWPALGARERQVLARWVAMVAISLEYNGRLIASLQGQRTQLMSGGVPGGWRVFVATLPDNKSAGRSHASGLTMPMGTFPGKHLQVQSTYFIIEKAIFHANYSIGEFAFKW